MLDCTDVNKLIRNRAGKRHYFDRLVLLTQWQLDCLKQIEGESRERFPREQEAILLDKIKAEVKTVKIHLILLNNQYLKSIGISLADYKVGENVNFNKFLVESLLSSYISISDKVAEIPESLENPEIPELTQNQKDWKTWNRDLKNDSQIQLYQYLDSSTKAKIDSYLNTRRNVDSLYTIYSTIESLEQTFKGNEISIEAKRLALQRAFYITGEYLKDTQISPNLSPDVKQSLEEKGVPIKALSKYRDTLAHSQVFPLIEGDDNQVKELFECFVPIQEVIKSKIIEIEDSFLQWIIEEKGKESKIDKSVVERLIESKSREGVQGLEKCIRTIKSEDTYHNVDNKSKKLVDEVYQNIRRMKSMDFHVDPLKPSGGKLSETELKRIDSIINYINQSKLQSYNKLRDEVAPSLERYVGELNKAHTDVVTIQKVIDRLSYTYAPNKSILDNFLSQQILEKIIVKDDRSLKQELERYFDAEIFKKKVAYVEFKDSKPTNLIDLLNNKISGTNINKEKLIGFFEGSKEKYITPEEYERLVEDLNTTDYYLKEKLFAYSIEWRKQKCVDLLKNNPSALKTIYDSILEGKSIPLSVYEKLDKEYQLPNESPHAVKRSPDHITKKIKELYSHRVMAEFDELKKVNNPYAVASQIINIYSLLENHKARGKPLDIKSLRHYLSHGDPLISNEDHKYIADHLVNVKNAIMKEFPDSSTTLPDIQSAIDAISLSIGVPKIIELLCPPGTIKRRPRSASKSCLTWEEIDKFNEGGAENRYPDNIIIDSEKFISIILREFKENREKVLNFIALANECGVIGDHKNKVNMLTENHRYLGHLERVRKVSGMVMHGMMAKNLVGELLRGDYKDVAINLGFLAGSPVLAKVAITASMHETNSILNGNELLGKALSFASPFISRGVTGFIAWDLFNQVKEYRKGNKDALVPIIGDSIQIATDVAETGVEIAEGFRILKGISAVTGPIEMPVAAIVFVGTDVYTAVRTTEKIDEYIRLTERQKVTARSRAFSGLRPSDDIVELIEEKDANNQAVKNSVSFLKSNPYIQRYVFPSMELNNGKDKKIMEVLTNIVLLDKKINHTKWSRSRPDNLEGIDLFCLPIGHWESIPAEGTYYCDGAIGVEYTNDRTGTDTLISLGDGLDIIRGFPGSSNIFVFGIGYKDMTGGDKDDTFIFGGKSVDAINDSEIEGCIDGRGGIDTIDVGQLTPHYEWSKGVGRYQVSADFRKGILKDTSKVNLNIKNINEFLGRKDGVDQVVFACDTKYVDGRGGENKNYLDSITIPKDDACSYDTKVTVHPYTMVTNYATTGNFLYFVKGEKGTEACIELGPSSQSNNVFVFNYTLKDVAAIDKSEKNIAFSFVEEFYRRGKKVDVNSSFNLTVSGADMNISTFHLIDRTKIVIGQNNVYAMQNTEKPIHSLVKDYFSIADKSQMYIVVHSNDEVLTVGHSHGDVLMNDPNARTSHLVGGDGEDVFVISSGHEKLTLTKLPISDVVIYDFDQENKIDTLDLRKIKEQLKKDINRQINTDVSKIGSDLLINLSLDDASKKEVVKIRLKGALENNWYKRVHIIIDSIFVIKEILGVFELTPQPLIFDDNSKTIYVINPTDVAEGGKIRVKKEIGDYIFARDNDALVITNSLSSSVDKNNLFTIILNDFYYGNNQNKMQSLKIEFNDQKIFVKKVIERVNEKRLYVRNFSELKRKVRVNSYKPVMYEIKKQKLFEAIEGNHVHEVRDIMFFEFSVKVKNNDGQTTIQSAAKSGSLEVVKFLIETKYADINMKDDSGKQILHYAVIGGSLEVVKHLIEERGANVNVTDDSKKVPLHFGAEYNRLEVVKYLIEEKGAYVNVKDNSGMVPLHYAVISGNLEVVKYLIEEKGADVDVRNLFKQVPLHYAAKGGSLEMVKYLLEEKGADVNAKDNSGMVPLQYAAGDGKLEVVKYFIEKKGADVNVKDDSGKQTLHYAVISGNLEVVKYLIEEKGADVNVEDDSKAVPLHLAANQGRLEVVKYLVGEKGADVNVKDDNAGVPLLYAAKGGSLEMIKYLIEEGADVDARDKYGLTVWHIAVTNGRTEVVKYFVEKVADINAENVFGMVPLDHAVAVGNLEVVKYLIEKGARIDLKTNGETPLNILERNGYKLLVDSIVKKLTERLLDAVKYDDLREIQDLTNQGVSVNVKDSIGHTLLDCAANNGKLKVVKYLVEKKHADVNVKTIWGRLPLHYAVISGNLEVVKYLIEEKGADANAKDDFDMIPLHLAAQYGRLEVVKYLIEEQGAYVNAKDNSLMVPLLYAAGAGHLEVVKYLIEEKGADVNVKDDKERLTLHYAGLGGNLEVVKYLIEEKGADANAKDDFSQVLLHYAAQGGSLEMVKYLVEEKGANVNAENILDIVPLHYAAEHNWLEVVKYLVEKGAVVDVRDTFLRLPVYYAAKSGSLEVLKYFIDEKGDDINATDSTGSLIFHKAVESGNLEAVRYLIEEKGVDVNVQNGVGEQSLHFAAKHGNLEMVKYLIEEKGANVNEGNWFHVVPLDYAAKHGRLEIVKYFIEEKGVKINVKDGYGEVPLHHAANGGSLKVVKYLIEEKGADINVKDNRKRTIFHNAVISGNLELVKYLIEEKGANVNAEDSSRTVPLHLAAMYNRLDVMKYLVEKKHADVNVKDDSGKVALHHAVTDADLEMIKYLTETKGIDLNVKDDSGSTPLDLAVSEGDSAIVKYLERKLYEEREKPRQHKRSHHDSSRKLLTTDSSNQPEIATSNTSEKSSWINDLVGPIVKLQESSAPSEAASNIHPIRQKRGKRHNDHSRHEDGMRMHRRVQKRNVEYQESHNYINQPEIATSSGTRPSSWINGLLDWIKEKAGGLVPSVTDKFAAKESEDSKSIGIQACSVRLEKMYSATIPNIPLSRKSQGVPKRNIANTSWSSWAFSREKVTSNVTDALEMNTTVLNNALILGDLAARLVNGTRHKQPIHENLLSLREKSMRFIDENMIMRTIQEGKEKFGGLHTNMDV